MKDLIFFLRDHFGIARQILTANVSLGTSAAFPIFPLV